MNDRYLFKSLPLIGILCLAIYGTGILLQESKNTGICQSNLRQIGLATRQYSRDYDDKCVLATHWSQRLLPYSNATQIFHCPSPRYDYSLNRYLSGVVESVILDTDYHLTPYVTDSNRIRSDGFDAGESWPQDGAHPVLRGGRGNNVLYFSGQVKWVQQKPSFHPIRPPKPATLRFSPGFPVKKAHSKK